MLFIIHTNGLKLIIIAWTSVHVKAQRDELKYAELSTADSFGFQSKITSAPVRAIQLDIPMSEAYSLESVGKHGCGKCVYLSACICIKLKTSFFWASHLFLLFCKAIEVGPQPGGVVRADIFNLVKEALDLTIEWLQGFNSGKKQPLVSKRERSLTMFSYLKFKTWAFAVLGPTLWSSLPLLVNSENFVECFKSHAPLPCCVVIL